jgi:GT2 family glycosyltransferase
MLISADGTSKQRGHLGDPLEFGQEEEVLLPSGSAALYRRAMVEEIGGFDEAFFLYCEDTDLGLRGRRAGWTCVYAPRAVVVHGYSVTSGAASTLKAYYVERNRLFVLIKNFPAGMLAAAPVATAARYFWHAWAAWRGRGAAGRYRAEGGGTLGWKERQRIAGRSRLGAAEYSRLLRRHSIGLREVAAL